MSFFRNFFSCFRSRRSEPPDSDSRGDVPPPAFPDSEGPQDWPAWLRVAEGELGVREIPGSPSRKRILEYHATTTLAATDDEVPWCSSFVNWCFVQVGLQGTCSARARSWLWWGRRLEEPRPGCLVVLRRGNSEKTGHVAFFLARLPRHVVVLGGNQRDRVQVGAYPLADLLAYIWPAGEE